MGMALSSLGARHLGSGEAGAWGVFPPANVDDSGPAAVSEGVDGSARDPDAAEVGVADDDRFAGRCCGTGEQASGAVREGSRQVQHGDVPAQQVTDGFGCLEVFDHRQRSAGGMELCDLVDAEQGGAGKAG